MDNETELPELAPEVSEFEVNRRNIWILAFLLLSPMILLALAMLVISSSNALFMPLLDGFKAFSALVLSFLAGIRWTAELMMTKPRTHILAFSFLPVLVGWVCLLVIGPVSIGILLIAICALGAWDSFYWYAQSEYRWFARIRNNMTLMMAALHILVLILLL